MKAITFKRIKNYWTQTESFESLKRYIQMNMDADTAIRQIHDNRYDSDLKEYFGNLLLVGVNYDKDAKGADAKRHSCVIERA